jgi:hypothetical protein
MGNETENDFEKTRERERERERARLSRGFSIASLPAEYRKRDEEDSAEAEKKADGGERAHFRIGI